MRARSCAVFVLILGVATAAFARSRTQLHFRVDLAAGTAKAIASPTLATTPLTTPRAAAPLAARYDKGTVVVRRGGVDVLMLAVGRHDTEWMPWSILQPGVFVFDWREIVVAAGKPQTSRDVVRGVDLATGRERWRRDTAGAIGAAVGDHLLMLNTGAGGFDLVDSQSGKTTRHVALAGSGPNAFAIAGGDTLIDTGEVLARIDGTGAIAWRADRLGAIVSVTPLAEPAARYIVDARDPTAPLPATGDWLVLTGSQLVRLDPATGKVRWAVPSSSTSLLLDGTAVLVTDIVGTRATSSATVRLIARDLATGKATRDAQVVSYGDFFDSARAVIVARRGDLVEVSTEFVVLD